MYILSKNAAAAFDTDCSAVAFNLRTDEFYRLDQVGGYLLFRMFSGDTLHQAYAAVVEAAEVSMEQIQRDFKPIIRELLAYGILQPGTQPPKRLAGIAFDGNPDTVSSPPTAIVSLVSEPASTRSPLRFRLAGYAGLLGAVLLKRLPLSWRIRTLRFAKRFNRREPTVAHTAQVVNGVLWAARHYPWRVACMEQAQAASIAGLLLGEQPDLYVGARFQPTVLIHAWVEARGESGSEPVGQYVPGPWPFRPLLHV